MRRWCPTRFTLPGMQVSLWDIGNGGELVGSAGDATSSFGFVYDAGVLTRLDGPGRQRLCRCNRHQRQRHRDRQLRFRRHLGVAALPLSVGQLHHAGSRPGRRARRPARHLARWPLPERPLPGGRLRLRPRGRPRRGDAGRRARQLRHHPGQSTARAKSPAPSRSATGQQSAFLYDINTGVRSGFTLSGASAVVARAVNDQGQITGWVADETGTHAWIGNASGYQVIPNLAGVSTVGAGVNNLGQVVGFYSSESGDESFGFIASPAVLPVSSGPGGSYSFSTAVLADVPIFLDPLVAVGYRYEIGAGNPLFKTVSLPAGIGDGFYDIEVDGQHFSVRRARAVRLHRPRLRRRRGGLHGDRHRARSAARPGQRPGLRHAGQLCRQRHVHRHADGDHRRLHGAVPEPGGGPDAAGRPDRVGPAAPPPAPRSCGRRPAGRRARAASAHRPRSAPPPMGNACESCSRRAGSAGWAARRGCGCARAGRAAFSAGVALISARVYGCSGCAKMVFSRAVFHRRAEVHHHHFVGHVLDHAEVVRDEHIAGAELSACRSMNRFRIWAWMETSSAETGSSATTTAGFRIIARAIAMRWALAAREHVGITAQMLGAQADLGDQRLDALAALGLGELRVDQQAARPASPRCSCAGSARRTGSGRPSAPAGGAPSTRPLRAPAASLPSSSRRPELGDSIKVSWRAKVDLPQPDSPTTASVLRASSANETPLRALTRRLRLQEAAADAVVTRQGSTA